MSTEKLKPIELIGIATIALLLLVLVYQTFQTNRIAMANGEIAIRNNYTSINEFVMGNPEFAELLSTAGSSTNIESDISPADQIRLNSWVFRLTNVWLASMTAYEEGILPKTTYDAVLDDIRNELELAGPGMRALYRQYMNNYSGHAPTSLFGFMAQVLDGYDD